MYKTRDHQQKEQKRLRLVCLPPPACPPPRSRTHAYFSATMVMSGLPKWVTSTLSDYQYLLLLLFIVSVHPRKSGSNVIGKQPDATALAIQTLATELGDQPGHHFCTTAWNIADRVGAKKKQQSTGEGVPAGKCSYHPSSQIFPSLHSNVDGHTSLWRWQTTCCQNADSGGF